jgi:transposase
MNTDWTQHAHFAALDWASDPHDVVVVDHSGARVAEFRFAHTASGGAEFTGQMKPFAGAPLALETSSGPAVDQLLQRGRALYPVNPKAAERYRERQAPSGTKTDRHDAWSLADALRTDGHGWRVLRAQDEATATLRARGRDELSLIEPRTALVNQLLAALREYYPAAREAFDDWTAPCAWAPVQQFPIPVALQSAGKRKWEKFLHPHRLWRSDPAPARLELFAHAHALPASAAILTATSLLATRLVQVRQALPSQLDEYRRRLTAAFTPHPDHVVFGSLPGAGEKLAPRLLGELGPCGPSLPTPTRCAARPASVR